MVQTTEVARHRFTPEERQCFFEDEIRMVNCNIDVGCRYEFSNCLLEAFTDKVRLSTLHAFHSSRPPATRDCNCQYIKLSFFFAKTDANHTFT